ncbi:MAG: oligosaccharide flippase family protein [Ruminococcus sp.]|nr:oligosaccharide flippase family protein [Ruminococcus sp.]
MIKSKMVRDTLLLTAMQLALDTAALLLNVFITRRLGASAIGILTLTGSFLGFAGILSNGNAFLCTSRLISEELGKPRPDPDRVLLYALAFCGLLSIAVSTLILLFAEPISERFFSGAQMTRAIRLMPVALASGAFASCFKGYFNACRKAAVAAAGDIAEFAVRAVFIMTLTLTVHHIGEERVCGIMIAGIIAGNVFSLAYCICAFLRVRVRRNGHCSIGFRDYVRFALPIMGGSVLTAALSSTNDALIPLCLRQYGDSVSAALSMFGIFEAIVIPTLFFPSVVLCSMSGIIVSETARAAAAGDRERIRSLTSRLMQLTLMFSIFAAAAIMRFGGEIGELLGGGELAGRMITLIAPVVPFIYMEIILEAEIKGMGHQAFSSLNYLAEYALRIAIVLIFVPRIGFYGIAASYYASNIVGNCSRLVKILRVTRARFRIVRYIAIPLIYAVMTMLAAELLTRLLRADGDSLPELILFTLIWGTSYAGFCALSGKCSPSVTKKDANFVGNVQLSTSKLL